MHDRWKHLRKNLFRSVEPEIELVGITQPVGRFKELCTAETLPAFTARISHESKGIKKSDKELNKNLIEWGHHTPLEATSLVYWINGITKSLQNQWVRQRIAVGWTYRSTRFVAAEKNEFVYCTFDYIDDEEKVKKLLSIYELTAQTAIDNFEIERSLGATKQDARKIMPVFWNTPCFFYCNARSLRYLFSLRLEKKAEWEIRRMTKMIWSRAMKEAPSLFEDFTELAIKED